MGGFFGIGQSRDEKNAKSGINNIFNYALPESQASSTSGKNDLGFAGDFFKSLLTAGRTDTAARSAPAINATLDASDTARRQLATGGTGRTGGSAEHSRDLSEKTDASIEDIINQNLVGGRAAGASGLASVGSTELQRAMQLLGLSTDTQEKLLGAENAKHAAGTDSFVGLAKAIL